MVRVALVTGGTRGIGYAISRRLAGDGFKVAANYAANEEAAKRAARELGISVYRWDVGDFSACEAGVRLVQSELGPVDVLVNNAGITRDVFLHKMTLDQWREVLCVDLDSAFNMTRAVIEGMRARSYGRIINIASVNAQKGQIAQTNYSAAKAGIVGFSKALALESAAKGITVNVIAPGYVDTEMVQTVPEPVLERIVAEIPVGRLGQAHEIAAAVSYVAHESSGFMTGATLSINGGQYIPT